MELPEDQSDLDSQFDAEPPEEPVESPTAPAAVESGSYGEGNEDFEQEEEADSGSVEAIPEGIRTEIKSVLSYMDQLLESLPEEKIQEFANSDHFDVYKRLFDELGLSS